MNVNDLDGKAENTQFFKTSFFQSNNKFPKFYNKLVYTFVLMDLKIVHMSSEFGFKSFLSAYFLPCFSFILFLVIWSFVYENDFTSKSIFIMFSRHNFCVLPDGLTTEDNTIFSQSDLTKGKWIVEKQILST